MSRRGRAPSPWSRFPQAHLLLGLGSESTARRTDSAAGPLLDRRGCVQFDVPAIAGNPRDVEPGVRGPRGPTPATWGNVPLGAAWYQGEGMAPRILVVEDEANIADYLVTGLREEGYAVEHAADGVSAWHRLEAKSWDLVLLDWWLPGQDGLALLRRLRQRDRRTP